MWQRWNEINENSLLEVRFFDISLPRWLAAICVAIAVLIVTRLVKAFAGRRLEVWAGGGHYWAEMVAGVVRSTRLWFLVILAAYCGVLVLLFALPVLPEKLFNLCLAVATAALLIQAAIWGGLLLDHGLRYYGKTHLSNDAASLMTISVLGFLARLAMWSLVSLMVLANFGVDVTALIAGLGVGGVAVALAAQNILGDIFASLSIVLDQPFVVGDFIVIGDFLGSVEQVGLKTTRVRSLSGEQLVLPNHDLLQSRIRNYKRMNERRVDFSLGVTYQTPYEKVASIPQLIREVVESQPDVRFDRAHFKQYGDFALIFEVVYYVLTPDYNRYMDIQQAINLALFQRFEALQIEFAYPTQTLYLQGPMPAGRQQPGNDRR